MSLECLVLIARLCLPAETQTIEIRAQGFGRRADIQVGSAKVGLIISSDEVGRGTLGLSELCQATACVHYRAGDDTRPQEVLRRYTFVFAGEPGPRSLVVEAPDRRQLRDTVAKMRVLVSGPGEHGVYVPLDQFVPKAGP